MFVSLNAKTEIHRTLIGLETVTSRNAFGNLSNIKTRNTPLQTLHLLKSLHVAY